jgi:hypothetical protein
VATFYFSVAVNLPEPTRVHILVILLTFALLSLLAGLAIAWPMRAVFGIFVGAGSGALVLAVVWLLMQILEAVQFSNSVIPMRAIPYELVPLGLLLGGMGAILERLLLKIAVSRLGLIVAILAGASLGFVCAVMPFLIFAFTSGPAD